MPENTDLIGKGLVVLPKANQTRPTLRLPFHLQKGTIWCFPPGDKLEGRPLAEWLGENYGADASVEGNGHALLTALPQSHQDGAFDAALEFKNGAVSIRITHADAFSLSRNAHFQGLDIRFWEDKAENSLSVSGGVKMVLFETVLSLSAKLEEARGLVLTDPENSSGEQEVAVSSIGTVNLTRLEISAEFDRWRDLKSLYSFNEGNGESIGDKSTMEAPLDLKVKKGANAVKWLENGLSIEGNALIQSETANRLMEAIWSTNELTVEAWIKPSAALPDQPSTFFSLSTSKGGNFLSLGHHPQHKGIVVTGLFFAEARKIKLAERLHLVFTRNGEGLERLFINGRELNNRTRPGSLRDESNWEDPNYLLTLGNSFDGTNPWQGEFYELAFYDRAVPEEEVLHHYFQSILLEGLFRIANAPAPLDREFSALLSFFSEPASISVQFEEEALELRPELQLKQLALKWTQQEGDDWTLNGTAMVLQWQNEVLTKASLSGRKNNPFVTFVNAEKPVELSLDGWGDLSFSSLQLKARKSGNKLSWALSTQTDANFFLLPAAAHRSVDSLVDMMLYSPQLAFTDDHLVLQGTWIGERLSLHGIRREEQLFLLSETDFVLPFSLNLPPIHDPRTGARLTEIIRLDRRDMEIQLSLEIGEPGFLTEVSSGFEWVDESETLQRLIIPAFSLYTSPPTKNALLGHVIRELRAQANQLFADQGRHKRDYFLSTGTEGPLIHLSASGNREETIRTTLPRIFQTSQTVEIGTGNPVFTIRQSGEGSELTLNLKDQSQDDLSSSYQNFWDEILNQQAFLPGGEAVLQRRIAERLPLSYRRLLKFYYGFHTENNYLDLHPGMRLRIDFQNYQFVQPSEQRARTGFAGSGSASLYVNSYTEPDGRQLIGFDAFSSILQLQTPAQSHEGGVDSGIGGLYELLSPARRKRHYRLFYPRSFSSGNGPARVPVLIGADSLTTLGEVTADWLDEDAFSAADDRTYFYFRDKATLVPEFQVFVHERPVYVAVGTTLRQLIERYQDIPPAGLPGQDLSPYLGAARPLRLIHEGKDSKPTYVFINLEHYPPASEGSDVLDLPLVKGDRFYF